jgi:hypothetical protein
LDLPLKTVAIQRFLERFTHADLARLYNHDMEMQVNVGQDGGRRIDGDFKGKQWHGWTDGAQTWKSFRIPYKANTEPEYEDKPLNFDLEAHAEGIGMTGWDWKSRVSRWVAYDFDAVTGHSDKHQKKLSQTELEEVAKRVSDVPWCSLRLSTSGKGLHLYVFLEPVPTKNHTEHAALARAILGQLSALTRFDFNTKVDICGGNMWVWHRKMRGTNGLSLLKAAVPLTQIPLNWQDHVNVVNGKRRKTLPVFIEDQKSDRSDIESWFDEVTGKQSRIPLDESHQKLVAWLRDNNCTAWWHSDHWMLVTHTFHLKEAHKALGLRGKFETIASGTESPNDHNCFLYPMRKGAWTIRRYSPGVAEAPGWDQDGAGWTRCFYNKEPDLKSAARHNEGIEHPAGGYSFKSASSAANAAEMLGAKINLPSWTAARSAIMKEHKDGRLVIEIEHSANDAGVAGMDGWIVEKNKYRRVFDVKARDITEMDVTQFDDVVRHIVSPNGDDFGWMLKFESKWNAEPLAHVKHALTAMGFSTKEVNLIIGSNIMKCWSLVNRPFQDEYPVGREWNRNAAQFRFRPTEKVEDLKFPTWLKILQHTGSGLDAAIQENEWCKNNAIVCGADYLKCWIASVFQFPLEPLPYLFFFGEEKTGKSIFHEALSLLVTHGIVRADRALESNFNGELANAIVCVVEETDLGRNRQAYNKIKDWVTARELSIRALYQTPYLIPNSTHWIQCGNDPKYCPIFPGDTRIVYCKVPPFKGSEMIPRKEFIPLLEKEAPDFLAEIMNLELPRSNDRLNIPVVITQDKMHAEDNSQTPLQQFVREKAHHVAGALMKFSEFYEKFVEWLDPADRFGWTRIKVGKELPAQFPRGRSFTDKGVVYIGNMSWEARESKSVPLIRKGDYITLDRTL